MGHLKSGPTSWTQYHVLKLHLIEHSVIDKITTNVGPQDAKVLVKKTHCVSENITFDTFVCFVVVVVVVFFYRLCNLTPRY